MFVVEIYAANNVRPRAESYVVRTSILVGVATVVYLELHLLTRFNNRRALCEINIPGIHQQGCPNSQKTSKNGLLFSRKDENRSTFDEKS